MMKIMTTTSAVAMIVLMMTSIVEGELNSRSQKPGIGPVTAKKTPMIAMMIATIAILSPVVRFLMLLSLRGGVTTDETADKLT
jgi:hypothetical protein